MEAILLNSGGKDALLSAILHRKQQTVLHSLFIDLGQPNVDRARKAAEKIASEHCADHFEMTIPGDWFVDSPKAPSGKSIPYQAITLAIMASLYARKINVDYIIIGLRGGFKDAFAHFSEALKCLPIPPKVPLYLLTIEGMSDDEVYTDLKDHFLLPELVSCNFKEPCGKCLKCVDRKKHGLPPN